MKNKIFIACLSLIIAFGALSGCKKDDTGKPQVTSLPVATPNPNISDYSGAFRTINGEPAATGGLTVLGDDFLKIMIDGKEEEFRISPSAQKQIDVFNKDKDNLMLMKGTLITIMYHTQNLVRYADEITIVNAN